MSERTPWIIDIYKASQLQIIKQGPLLVYLPSKCYLKTPDDGIHVDWSLTCFHKRLQSQICVHRENHPTKLLGFKKAPEWHAYVRTTIVKSLLLTASSRIWISGWSLGVCLRISFRSSGYLTSRLRGMSKKLQRSSLRLKGDSRQRWRKSCTLRSCFFWSRSALAASWLLQ